jgi:hypothetical protein
MKIDIVSRFLVPSTARTSSAEVAPAPRAYRGLIWVVAVVAAISLACGCGAADDPAAPDAGRPDAAPESDAVPVPDASGDTQCTQECLSETLLRECAGGERTVECPLGCVTDEARCGTFVPSNGASAEHLLGVTEALTVAEDAQVIVDTSIGSITVGGQTLRGPGVGVNNGIGFQYTADGQPVFAVQRFTMGARANLRARGERPLLILSAGDVEIAGTIDVSAGCDPGSSAKTCGGPGGGRGAENQDPATGCGIGGDGDNGAQIEVAGGGGGGFGQAGAAGGGDARVGVFGGGGGGACDASLVPLRGGSGGGRSGLSSFPGAGGGGGGAVQISSYTAIRLVSPAIIDAGGSGGSGEGSGGGGGGSGGGILLEAPMLSSNGAVLAANGGGGGGGFDEGEDGRLDVQQAQGAGAGGLGGALAGSATQGIMDGNNQGGGGGGGAGLIRLRAPLAHYVLINTTASPAPVRLAPEAE